MLRLRRPASAAGSAGGDRGRPLHRRPGRAGGAGAAGGATRLAVRRPAARHRERRGPRAARAPGLSQAGRPGLPGSGPGGADPERRRGAAHPAGRAARIAVARRLLRAGRAVDRHARARQPAAAGDLAAAAGAGQHGRGGGARRGDDPQRRPRRRSGSGRRRRRRPRGRARQPGRGDGERRLHHRPHVARPRPAPDHRPAARCRRRLAHRAGGGAAQPARHGRAHPASGGHLRHRRERLRQEHPGAPAAVRSGARTVGGARCVPLPASAARGVDRLPIDRRLAGVAPRAAGRPDADRQDAALLSGHLRRRLGRGARPVRRRHRGARPRLRRRPLLLQPRRRPVRGMRGSGGKEAGDELPAGRGDPLRGVRRRPLRSGDAGGARARSVGRRRAGARRGGGGRGVRRPPAHRAGPAPVGGGGVRLPDARAAQPDAERRRGATHQAGRRAGQARPGGRRRHPLRPGRADDRSAHGRRRPADARAAPAGRPR